MIPRKPVVPILLAATLGWGLVPAAAAKGLWTTYIRPYGFNAVEAGTDSVWFGTANAGLLLYDRRTGALRSTVRDFGELSANEIASLARDRRRRLWVGTLGGGVSRLGSDGRWTLVNQFDGLPSDSITVITAYGDTIWIGTPQGLAFWNGTEISGRLPDGVNPSPFASDRITGVIMLGDSVWTSTMNGVYFGRMSGGLQIWTARNDNLPFTEVGALVAWNGTPFALCAATVWRLTDTGWMTAGTIGGVLRLVESHGVLLASTRTGLQRWTGSGWVEVGDLPDSGAPSRHGVSQYLLAAGADETGSVFAAFDRTVYVPDGATWSALDAGGPVENLIVNLLHDGRTLYAVTRDDGVSRLRDGAWSHWSTPVPGDPARTDQPYYISDPFAALIDGTGRKWFSVWSDAIEIVDDSQTPEVWTHLWIGSGLSIDQRTWGWASAVDPDGGVWIGGESPCIDCTETPPGGLDYYNSAGTYVRTYGHAQFPGLLSDEVRALAVGRGGKMWVGCANYGGTGGVTSFTIPDNQTGEDLTFDRALALTPGSATNVFGIETYGDSVWVLSADSLRLFRGGATRYPIIGPPTVPGCVHPLEITPDGSAWTAADGGVRVYHRSGGSEDFTTENSPLANNSVLTIRREPGSSAVWIATLGGLNRYDPSWVAPPPPAITSLSVKVYPNPVSLSALGFSMRLVGEGNSYRGAVYGIDGRKVTDIAAAGNGAVAWGGRDQDGRLVRPGVYFLRVEAGGRSATARLVVLR